MPRQGRTAPSRTERQVEGTYGQTLDARFEQLKQAGCGRGSGEGHGRTGLPARTFAMIKALATGDVVTVTCIDRLASSTFDLFAIIKGIVDGKGQYRSLVEPWPTPAPAPGT